MLSDDEGDGAAPRGLRQEGDANYYHIVPCVQEEDSGIYPAFSRNKDVISSLCMFHWGLPRAAEAAELLGVDASLRAHWRERLIIPAYFRYSDFSLS